MKTKNRRKKSEVALVWYDAACLASEDGPLCACGHLLSEGEAELTRRIQAEYRHARVESSSEYEMGSDLDGRLSGIRDLVREVPSRISDEVYRWCRERDCERCPKLWRSWMEGRKIPERDVDYTTQDEDYGTKHTWKDATSEEEMSWAELPEPPHQAANVDRDSPAGYYRIRDDGSWDDYRQTWAEVQFQVKDWLAELTAAEIEDGERCVACGGLDPDHEGPLGDAICDDCHEGWEWFAEHSPEEDN